MINGSINNCSCALKKNCEKDKYETSFTTQRTVHKELTLNTILFQR